MHKSKAIELLGGTVVLAAKAIGISYQAVDKWPDQLPARIADRVLAAVARKHLPPGMIGEEPVSDQAEIQLALTDRRERDLPIDFPDRRAAGQGAN